ncbi:MAG: hypothetical protein E7620_06755 [Ruminococcaceae bacterium]|nr:hypothetical protein [Oscillospiraceae bacterium]
MKNKKLLKSLGLFACAILLVVGSVTGTMAYLTSRKTVTNTFSFGNVSISMDESKVNLYGVPETPASRVTENQYKLIPGQTYVKDPIITVAAGSEECYLYVKIDNDLTGIEVAADDTADATESIEEQLIANGWVALEGVSKVYVYMGDKSVSGKVKAGVDTPVAVDTFGNFTVKSEVSSTTIDGFGIKTIVVTAYAVQTAGFADAKTAFTTAFAGGY